MKTFSTFLLILLTWCHSSWALFMGWTGTCYCWTGPYLGLNIGYGWGHAPVSTTIIPEIPSFFTAAELQYLNQFDTIRLHPDGLVGGIHGGYNFQPFRSRIVLGLEGDFELCRLSDHKLVNTPIIDIPASSFEYNRIFKTYWMASFRPRLGYALGYWLPFVTGGLALHSVKLEETYTDNSNKIFVPNSIIGVAQDASRREVIVGWIVGGGVEYGFSECMTASLTYLYSHFGHIKAAERLENRVPRFGFPIQSDLFINSAKYSNNQLRFAINWRL